MEITEPIPLDLFEKMLTRWWFLALLIVLGGAAGWSFSLARPPVYEARAQLLVYNDFAMRSGVWSESRAEYSLTNASSLISPHILGPELIDGYQQVCYALSVDSLQIERRESIWDLVVHCSDPQGAADLANAWVDSAQAALNTAYEHSLKVEELSIQIGILNGCDKQSTDELCGSFTSLEELHQHVKTLQNELRSEQDLSKGMTPSLIVQLESPAEVPSKPISRAAGSLILAGAVFGLLVGLLVMSFLPPGNKQKVK